MTTPEFTSRPLTIDDAQHYVDLRQAISVHNGTNLTYTVDSTLMEWQEPHFELSNSSLGIFNIHGELVAFAVIWDKSETPVRPWILWGIHPDHYDVGLDPQLFQWVDKISKRIIDRCPPTARLSLQSSIKKGYTPMETALIKAGYIPTRYSYEMRIDMETQPSSSEIPKGFSMRNYRHPEDLSALVEVFRDSFSDHFGYVEESFEKVLKEFEHWFNTDKNFDPDYVYLAIDDQTHQIIGYLIAFKEDHNDPNVGYIELVGVRKDYRRRGLAQAMLYHAFNKFWEIDQKSVMLGVDGESLTNAVALYQRVGMHVYREYTRYEKLIREGEELAKISV